jgi:hypothetical protein
MAKLSDRDVVLKAKVAEATSRAGRNGLTLELGDQAGGAAWPGKRFASAHLMRGSEQVAGYAHSYQEGTSEHEALLSCLDRVFNRPV